jgi:hypothetical protein
VEIEKFMPTIKTGMRIMDFTSPRYRGVYLVEGSCGHLNISPEDDLQRLIGEEFMRIGSESVFSDGTTVCKITMMTYTHPDRPAKNQVTDYVRSVHIEMTPPETGLPQKLESLLTERGYKEFEDDGIRRLFESYASVM